MAIVSRQHRHAARVDLLRTRHARATRCDRHDTPAPDDNGASIDRGTSTDDDAGVGDDEILRSKLVSGSETEQEHHADEGTKALH
jgi:hypothetical protein